MYKHTVLVRHVGKGIDRIDSPLLNRAWEIVKECIEVHALIDREEGQTVRLARSLAWKEWVDAYQGEEETTCTFSGLVDELVLACPDEEKLDTLIAEGHALAQGQSLPKKPQPPASLSLAYENPSNEKPREKPQKKHLKMVVDNSKEPPQTHP